MASDTNSPPGRLPGDFTSNDSSETAEETTARLVSWKEIAGYFQRDIRTVQFWEKKEGLPVHRHNHEGRSSVYAFAGELDAWLRMRSKAREDPPSPVPPSSEPDPPAPELPPERRPRMPSGLWRIAALLLVGAGMFFLIRREIRQRRPPPLASRMLAVLPFRDLTSLESPAPQDFLVDGLTDDLITDLGRSGQLAVMSSRSAMRFKTRGDPVPAIASELHASLILVGSVVQHGGTVRVTAQLLDAAQGRQIWAGSYSRSQGDVMELQDEIAAEIAGDVIHNLTTATPAISFNAKPVNPQVRIDYLTGHYLWEQRNEPDMLRAIASFQHAIALDSGYAPAWVGLADSYNLMAVWGTMRSSEAFPKARSAAEMALSLDPNSAEAYNSLAFETYRYEWDFSGADRDFRRSIALNPNYAVADQWYGEFLGDLRRFDPSIAELRRARDLDPLSAMVGSDLADAYLHAGRYPEAKAQLQQILVLYPHFVPAHNYLATVCSAAGEMACAGREARVYAQLSGNHLPLEFLTLQEEVSAGHTTQARRDLSQFLRTRAGAGLIPYQKAQLDFAAGETDAGYAALNTALQQRSWWLVTLMVDPGFESVRRQPRFVTLERLVGLPIGGPASW